MGNRLLHPLDPPSDRRHRFALGNLACAKDVIPMLTAQFGSETEARFTLGEMIHRHLCGYHGQITLEDRVLNEHVLREHNLRRTGHVVVSVHRANDLRVDLVTDLGTRQTRIRLADTHTQKFTPRSI